MKKSEINFAIHLDENHLPLDIRWVASDLKEQGNCKSVLISLWDPKEQNTLKIDLWTKDMSVGEMKKFFHQTLLSLADSFERATGETKISADMRDFCQHFAEKMNLFHTHASDTPKPDNNP